MPGGWVTLQDIYRCTIDAELFGRKIGEAQDLVARLCPVRVTVAGSDLFTHKESLEDWAWEPVAGTEKATCRLDPGLRDRLAELEIPFETEEGGGGAGSELREQVAAIERWYLNDWMALDAKLRTSIVEGISVFLSLFDQPQVASMFCPPPPDPDVPTHISKDTPDEDAAAVRPVPGLRRRLPPLAELIEGGRVLALNMPAGANPALGRAIGVLLRLAGRHEAQRRAVEACAQASGSGADAAHRHMADGSARGRAIPMRSLRLVPYWSVHETLGVDAHNAPLKMRTRRIHLSRAVAWSCVRRHPVAGAALGSTDVDGSDPPVRGPGTGSGAGVFAHLPPPSWGRSRAIDPSRKGVGPMRPATLAIIGTALGAAAGHAFRAPFPGMGGNPVLDLIAYHDPGLHTVIRVWYYTATAGAGCPPGPPRRTMPRRLLGPFGPARSRIFPTRSNPQYDNSSLLEHH